MIVRKQILREVDYFDSAFFVLCEDMDLCWRIRLNGHKVTYVPKFIFTILALALVMKILIKRKVLLRCEKPHFHADQKLWYAEPVNKRNYKLIS
jgi:cellulose synthase/poly-beta-1,6-N-acetylglucosamine synthase-like glycosyltransferase